ncbi:MAG: hypothetical protein IV100_09115 [Myxococcales bacterium]|nr:hypothetical protein [Myxococcales bacterium]
MNSTLTITACLATVATGCTATTSDGISGEQFTLLVQRVAAMEARLTALDGKPSTTSPDASGADGSADENSDSSNLDASESVADEAYPVDFNRVVFHPQALIEEPERWLCSTEIDGRCVSVVGDGFVKVTLGGQLLAQGYLDAGVRTGAWECFSTAGAHCPYVSDGLGYISHLKGEYRAGKPHGAWIGYSDAGAVQFEGAFADGKQVGTWTIRDADGQLNSSGIYDDSGCRVGLWESFTYQLVDEKACGEADVTFVVSRKLDGSVSCQCSSSAGYLWTGNDETACSKPCQAPE